MIQFSLHRVKFFKSDLVGLRREHYLWLRQRRPRVDGWCAKGQVVLLCLCCLYDVHVVCCEGWVQSSQRRLTKSRCIGAHWNTSSGRMRELCSSVVHDFVSWHVCRYMCLLVLCSYSSVSLHVCLFDCLFLLTLFVWFWLNIACLMFRFVCL